MEYNNIVDNIPTVIGGLGIILTLVISIWYGINIKRIEKLEKDILEKQKEYDEMLITVHNKTRGHISQSQLEAITARDRKPIEQEINILKLKRQFILDKLPLVGYFKK